MLKHLSLLLIMFMSSHGISHPGEYTSSTSWQIAPVFAMAALANGAGGSRYDLGAGLQGDVYLWRFGDWLLGPGVSLSATSPTKTGNTAVRVSPYSLYSEQRFSTALVLARGDLAFLPFMSLFSNVGIEIFDRHVRRQRSINSKILLSLGSRLGFSLWFKAWGLTTSYDLSFGTNKFRQELLFGVAYNWSNEA